MQTQKDLKMFFWVFPRRQIIVGRRFGTLYRFHLQRLVVELTWLEENAGGKHKSLREVYMG